MHLEHSLQELAIRNQHEEIDDDDENDENEQLPLGSPFGFQISVDLKLQCERLWGITSPLAQLITLVRRL
jgi:hypothetical protein